MSSVGTSVIRKDAHAKAAGLAIYVADMTFPRMLYAAVLRSPHPHAGIVSIDTSKAERMPGVAAILQAKDIPGKNCVQIIFDDMPLLADKTVRYVGEPIALVAAESQSIAWEAISNIQIKYQPLDPLLDFRKSRSPQSPKLYQENNTYSHHLIHCGDIAAASQNTKFEVEGAFETPYQEHAYLEPQGMLAIPQPDGAMQIIGSMQCPFYIQPVVAEICDLPLSKVVVKQAETGGAFGGKEDVPSILAGHAALLAQRTGRPVKMVYRRDEDIISMSKRHPSLVSMKIGCDEAGKLKFIEGTVLLDAGAYATLSPVVLWRSLVHATGAYVCANIRLDAYAVATNHVPAGAFRGFGSPQSLFAVESLIDDLALKAGFDPIDFRKINCLKDGLRTGTGQMIQGSCGLVETIRQAAKASQWDKKRKQPRDIHNPIKRGLGVSTVFYGVGLGAGGKRLARTGAFLQIAVDGSVQVSVGTIEMGQGMRTVLSQIAADGLGLAYDDISWIDTDTSRVPDSGPTVASRATTMSGLAILDACQQARRVLARVASEKLACPPEKLIFKNGFCSDSNGETKLDLKDLIAECHRQRLPMAFQGFAISPDTNWNQQTGQGKAYIVYAYATNIAEVTVDTRTGEITVEKIWAAHDVGKAVNPAAVKGQIQGGTLQGLGYCLLEEYRIENGFPLNPDFTSYLIPTAMDTPIIEPIIVEHAYSEGPFGAKGFGEQPLMGVAPAIANAVRDAIGIRFYELPLIPERIWEALNLDTSFAAKT